MLKSLIANLRANGIEYLEYHLPRLTTLSSSFPLIIKVKIAAFNDPFIANGQYFSLVIPRLFIAPQPNLRIVPIPSTLPHAPSIKKPFANPFRTLLCCPCNR